MDAGAPSPPRARRPWWIPHFLGSVPEVAPHHLRMLGLVALALFFEQYDFSMLTAVQPRVRAEFGVSQSQMGFYLSLVRLGALPAFVILPQADRLGRRRLFLLCVVAISLGTSATALAQSIDQFVAAQMLTRGFMITGMSIAFVMVTEEFPAQHRGWGIGLLGALGGCGFGLGAAVFAAVDHLPYGWRGMYALGLLPLLLLPRFRRGIQETRRFERLRSDRIATGDEHGALLGGLRPIVDLLREHPQRAFLLALIAFSSTFGVVSVFAYTSDYTASRGWAPWEYSLMFIGGGGVGIIGNVVAGRLGDRIGRRLVGALAFLVMPAAGAVFYNGPGWSLPAAWVVLVFCSSASQTITRALGTELFPTAQRGTAMGLNAVVETFAAAAGLAALGLLTREEAPLPWAVTRLCAATLAAALLIRLLPETRARELEEIEKE